ncbi:penicillin-binding protein 2 [Candidatus Saccharibacteria bacterium]|nr:penicillin-binding protein 2 [Candidatus Saccharibacteria bacterium]
MKSRNKALKICLAIIVGVIAVRLFFIQIVEHDDWQAKADEQQTSTNTIIAKRGEIYMMDGSEPAPIAMNETVWSVIIDPKIVDEEKVRQVIDENAGEQKIVSWEEAFQNKELRYFVIAKDVKRAAAEKIAEADLNGVILQENTRRVYPEGDLASRLLGFVNMEGSGQYGVEGSLDKLLAGENGLLKTTKDINNVILSIGENNIRMPAKNGETVVLSVDRNLEHGVEKILTNAVNRTAATNASAIVMDPRDGRVLAMANVPNYDPANYADVEDAKSFINYTIEEPYEPASVCKVFTFATAINEGVMTPETTYTNTGSVEIDGEKIENAYKGQLGVINMQTVLNYSLNTGSIQALRLLSGSETEISEAGRQKLYEYYHDRFGLGQYTDIELSESPGYIVEPNDGWAMDLTYANMTFGQGLNLTTVQVASAFSSVINGGKYYTPTIVAGTMKNGEFVKKDAKPAVRETISEETSATMRNMLRGTRASRQANGTDKAGYFVGGKTGTAQVVQEDGTYSDAMGETIASYVGFGGTDGEMPEYVIMVKIWGAGQHMEGEKHAMPIFDELSNYTQNYLKIKPKA